MQVKNLHSIFIRFAIIAFWLLVIFGFLYLPEFAIKNLETKTINVFAWSGSFDLAYVAQFEKQTGINVNLSYYESNEEMLTKIRATKGYGYDLIVPSDYAVNILRTESLIKKIDKQKLNFIDKLNPVLLGHYYDPSNEYSLPYEWGIFGLGIDKEFFSNKLPQPSWNLIFDPAKIKSRIIMSNDPLVSIPIAAFYLYGTLKGLNAEKFEEIKKLLIAQKKHVEAYADFRADYYLATRNCPVAVSSSAYIWRSMRVYPFIDFIIPSEGTLVTIENCAIPITSNKDDLVYKFLEFLYSPKNMANNFNERALFPVTTDVLDHIKVNDTVYKLLTLNKEEFKKFSFLQFDEFSPEIDEQSFQDLWVAIKS